MRRAADRTRSAHKSSSRMTGTRTPLSFVLSGESIIRSTFTRRPHKNRPRGGNLVGCLRSVA